MRHGLYLKRLFFLVFRVRSLCCLLTLRAVLLPLAEASHLQRVVSESPTLTDSHTPKCQLQVNELLQIQGQVSAFRKQEQG